MDDKDIRLNPDRFEKLNASSPSLRILMPESSVVPTNTPAPTPTSRHLEKLSREVISILCYGDWNNPVIAKHMTENYQAYLEHCAGTTRSLQEHIEAHKKIHKAFPGYLYDVRSCDVDVDEEKGLATAWVVLVVTGNPDNIQRESMTVFWWRRRTGLWRCYKQFALSGIDWFPAEVRAI